jgi:hypothetical protein
MGNKPSQPTETTEPIESDKVKNADVKVNNKPKETEESTVKIDPEEIDNILFTKILKLAKEILNRYNETFLSPSFYDKVDIIHKNSPLAIVQLSQLEKINNKLNENNTKSTFELVLKYDPGKETKFVADEFKIEALNLFFKKSVETPDLNKLGIDISSFPKFTLNDQPYINTEYVNKIMQHLNNKKMVGGSNSYSKNLERRLGLGTTTSKNVSLNKSTSYPYKINNREQINENNNNINISKLKEHQAKINGENIKLGNITKQITEKRVNNREQNREKNTEENAEKNTEKNTEKNREQNREQNTENKEKKRANNTGNATEKKEKNVNYKEIAKQTHKCSESNEHCYLTKLEICGEIKKHYLLRKNIVETIISNIPLKTDKGYLGSFCYQRYINLNECKICLPFNYLELNNMPIDERILNLMLFVNNMDKSKCNEHNGYFKVLSNKEKKALFLNDSNFNKYYIKYSVLLREKYMVFINQLYNILVLLNENEAINNKTLNELSQKTKEIIDNMYYLCQYYYLSAIISLLRADLEIKTNQKTNANDDLQFLGKLVT